MKLRSYVNNLPPFEEWKLMFEQLKTQDPTISLDALMKIMDTQKGEELFQDPEFIDKIAIIEQDPNQFKEMRKDPQVAELIELLKQ